MNALIDFLSGLPPALAYLVLGAGATLENIVPPVPADTFVLLGGVLAGTNFLDPWTVFLVTWASNVTSALLVYGAGSRYGRPFFRQGVGRHLLKEGHMSRLQAFYDRWGPPAIFVTRFLPGFRAVVPVFAGVTKQRFLPVAAPILVASAIWYGALVWLGVGAGRNLEAIVDWISEVKRILLLIALLLAVGAGVWWYRVYREHRGESNGD